MKRRVEVKTPAKPDHTALQRRVANDEVARVEHGVPAWARMEDHGLLVIDGEAVYLTVFIWEDET
jgi:hypothetical protein